MVRAPLDYEAVDALRERHPAWRLLRAGNAALILSFLGEFFVEANRGGVPAREVAAALDDRLHAVNAALAPDGDEVRFPKGAHSYLDDWSASDDAFLRRYYPAGDDEVHYEVTPAFEKAYSWVASLGARSFVGTESRLHTVVELLRQIVRGSESDPELRLAELRRRRQEIDDEIAAVEAGRVAVLDGTAVRDRYQQAAATARDLLADFREVEDNFRQLDRAAREQITAWEGSKGELLRDLIGSRSQITGSDQGRSFQAFYDFLLSASRQEELADLLAKVAALDSVEVDHRMRTIHHDWSEAAERAQRTVRQISEQLRRFLDERVWLENRRVIDVVRAIESAALAARSTPPTFGLEIDEPGIEIALPFERPLYSPPPTADVASGIAPSIQTADADLLFAHAYVDTARLARNVRAVLPARSSVSLADIIELYPVDQGAAEIVGYLALADDDLEVEMDDGDQTVIAYVDPSDSDRSKQARLPHVTIRRS
jgi:hypothetical protein